MAAAELWGAVRGVDATGVGAHAPGKRRPLSFDMRLAEGAAALPGMTELRRFQADPSYETLGLEFGTGRAEPAVYAYFVDGRLFCVAVDAVHGPQVTLWGRELTACAPDDLDQFLCHAHLCGGSMCPTVRGETQESSDSAWWCGCRRLPAVWSPGRSWWAGHGPTGAPTTRKARSRNVNGWGRLWPYPQGTESWPPPGHKANWGDWHPPFSTAFQNLCR